MYIRSVFSSGNSGFDRIRLHSSSSVPIEFVSFRQGTEAQLRAGTGRNLWPGPLDLERLEDGSVELAFPAPVTGGRPLYEARFRTRVFLSGTTFGAELKSATRPEIVQAVSEGDAGSLAASQSLVVVADVENFPLLDRVRLVPRVFTPNGDGTNDQTEIRFTIYRLIRARQIEVGIYDLVRPQGARAFAAPGKPQWRPLGGLGWSRRRRSTSAAGDLSGTRRFLPRMWVREKPKPRAWWGWSIDWAQKSLVGGRFGLLRVAHASG